MKTIPLIENIKTQIVNPVITVMMALALLFFLYGVAEFIFNPADTQANENGKKHIVWGLIGLFIMFGVFGILHVVCSTIGTTC